METINFDSFLLRIKQQNGWKKLIYINRKTTNIKKTKINS